jgi:hypothetical protein
MNASIKNTCRNRWICLLMTGLGTGAAFAQTVNLDQIKEIRTRHVLTEQQLGMINTFVTEQFNLLMSVTDSGKELADRQAVLLENSRGSAAVPGQPDPYAQQFAQAVKNTAPKVFEYTAGMEDKKMGLQIRLAAMVIMINTDNPELIGMYLNLLKDPAEIVRYWAVKGLMTPIVGKTLAATEASAEPWPAILSSLNVCLDAESSPVVIRQIARAGAIAAYPGCSALIKKCIAKRLTLYQNWTVDQEQTDLDLIQTAVEMAMRDSLQSDKPAQHDLIKSAAELFTAAYQRYTKGVLHPVDGGKTISLLSPKSQEGLETILIEGEATLMRAAAKVDNTLHPSGSRFLKILQTPTVPNLDRIYEVFMRELNKAFQLFPEQTGANPQYFPPLPDPPETLVQNALNKSKLKIIKAEEPAKQPVGGAATPQ